MKRKYRFFNLIRVLLFQFFNITFINATTMSSLQFKFNRCANPSFLSTFLKKSAS